MFVCLCTGVTSQVVTDLVAEGASTSKQIADGVRRGCRLRPVQANGVRAIIAAAQGRRLPGTTRPR